MSRFSIILHRHKNTKTIQIQCVKNQYLLKPFLEFSKIVLMQDGDELSARPLSLHVYFNIDKNCSRGRKTNSFYCTASQHRHQYIYRQ